MGIIVDLIIVGIVLLSVFLGYRKGFVSLAIKLCAFIIAIAVTFIFYQPISNFVINTTQIDEMLENTIIEKATDMMQEDPNSEMTNSLIESAKQGVLPETARALAINIVSGAVILILFIGIRIALIFVTALANAVAKLPIINQFNKTGGIAYGLLRGVLIVYVALLVIHVYGQMNPKSAVYQGVEDSYIGKTMGQYNVLNVFFKS